MKSGIVCLDSAGRVTATVVVEQQQGLVRQVQNVL